MAAALALAAASTSVTNTRAGGAPAAAHASSPAASPQPATRPALAGNWHGFAVEGKGEQPDRGPVRLELVVTDTTIEGVEIKSDNRIDHGKGTYTIDPSASPGTLDASRAGPNGRVEQYLGIYSVEGDTLKWCVTRQKRRPTTFETSKGQFLLILRRVPG
jgi:uncharacterized protein (TIGR03067 family)